MLASWGHLLSVGVHSSYRTPLWPFCSILFCSVVQQQQLARAFCVHSIHSPMPYREGRLFVSFEQMSISASINVASDKASALMCPLNSHTHTTHTPYTHLHTHLNTTCIKKLTLIVCSANKISNWARQKALHTTRGTRALRAAAATNNNNEWTEQYTWKKILLLERCRRRRLLLLWRNELTATQSRDQLRRHKRQQQHLRSSSNSSCCLCLCPLPLPSLAAWPPPAGGTVRRREGLPPTGSTPAKAFCNGQNDCWKLKLESFFLKLAVSFCCPLLAAGNAANKTEESKFWREPSDSCSLLAILSLSLPFCSLCVDDKSGLIVVDEEPEPEK